MVEVKEENKADGYASNGDGGNNTGGGGNTSSASSTAGKQLEPEQFRKLFIGGLSLSTTDEGLKQFYSQFGELLDCVVMRDSQTKKSRGFGFVSFSTKEEVDKAMSARPHEIDGKTVDPKRAVPRDQSSRSESNISTKRLYVSGVREEHKEDDFSAYFSTFGNVLKVEIITDKVTEKPRGFAFVSFDDYDAVDKCVLQKSHMINNYRCDVKKALSKDDMARAQQMDRDRQDRGARSRGNQRNGPWQGVGGAGPGARGSGYGRDAGGGGYGSWGGGPPTGSSWGGPASQWGPGGAYGGAGGYGGYGGGYGAGGGAGGGWGAGGAAAGGPPPASWGAAGGASGGVGGAGAAGAWGSAGSWSSDASAAGWGTAQGTGGGAPAGQWAGATGGGWPTGAPAGASGPPGGAPGRF